MTWSLYKTVQFGERVWRSYKAGIPSGTAYRETVSYEDQANGLIKVIDEAVVFTAVDDGDSLSWQQEASATSGERTDELYSAQLAGNTTAYLCIVSYSDQASGRIKTVSVDMSTAQSPVRSFQPGKMSEESEYIMAELKSAVSCLINNKVEDSSTNKVILLLSNKIDSLRDALVTLTDKLDNDSDVSGLDDDYSDSVKIKLF